MPRRDHHQCQAIKGTPVPDFSSLQGSWRLPRDPILANDTSSQLWRKEPFNSMREKPRELRNIPDGVSTPTPAAAYLNVLEENRPWCGKPCLAEILCLASRALLIDLLTKLS